MIRFGCVFGEMGGVCVGKKGCVCVCVCVCIEIVMEVCVCVEPLGGIKGELKLWNEIQEGVGRERQGCECLCVLRNGFVYVLVCMETLWYEYKGRNRVVCVE